MQSDATKIGTVIHYFAEPEVGAVRLEGDLEVGDTVAFRGATTDFSQEVGSLEVDHEPVESAGAGDEIAVKVEDRVREGDEVYRL
jgi:translation elongation factor EF-1alpha